MRGVQASTWAGFIMFGAVMAGGAAGAAPAVGDDGPFIGSSDPTASFVGYRCEYRSAGCPKGLVLADNNGNHLGCSVTGHLSLSAECEGDCYTCGGNVGAARICMASPGHTCNADPTIGRIVHCGLVRRHEAGCTGNQPTGVPTTPNGCYCKPSAPAQHLLEACQIQECQL